MSGGGVAGGAVGGSDGGSAGGRSGGSLGGKEGEVMLPLTEATTSARAKDESRRSAEVIAAIEEERLGSIHRSLEGKPQSIHKVPTSHCNFCAA